MGIAEFEALPYSAPSMVLAFDHRHEPAPVFELVQQYWVMVGPSNRPFICALYRTTTGLELRAGHGEQDALLRQPVVTEFAAETFAAAWRIAAEAKGFVDLQGV